MEKLIKKYIKTDDADILHNLRVNARKTLSRLMLENKTDLGLEDLLKYSSKLRDTDVLINICKNKRIKKFLDKKHIKLRKKFIKFLKNFESCTMFEKLKKENISINQYKKISNKSFLKNDDKTLHKIRIEIKKYRYTNPKFEIILKKIQDNLGKAHDYYNCEKLSKKFGFKTKKIEKKKIEYIKKAEKIREDFINSLE